MMYYPNSFEDKIGFSQIRMLLKEQCISAMGREKAEVLSYSSVFEEIVQNIELSDEFRSILLYEDPFPAQDFHDLRNVLERIHIDGTFIELDELALLRGFIQAMIQIVVYLRIRNEEGKFPRLWDLCKDVLPEKNLLESINKILDAKGNLRENASDELRRIKRDIIRISADADKKMRKLLHQAKQSGFVKEDAEMTIRNGRLCIPVPSVFKRKLHGFIHDESASGQTVFIEPSDVFDANNELKELYNAERREIIRILTEISNEIRPAIPSLLKGHSFIGSIDFIRAKAKLSLLLHAIKPNILNSQIIHWEKAIHPLLFLNLKESGKSVVPLTIKLSKEERILIISGPNAGGKSVCLKTVGLLQYMMQCGLLVPMQETSDMGIFTDFFIDIGDQQSIEDDLSTYSSHLQNLKMMIEHLNSSSLFLIDEFGSGTEPTLGGAMAEAILEKIYELEAFGIITTHYGNLKAFPDHHKKSLNGAMLFDTKALKPLFQLKIGTPGSSFTYEIAKQIGLPENIIQRAIEKSGTAQIDYEKKLEEIESDKIEIEKTLKLVHNADDQLALMIQEYADKYYLLEKQRKDILQNAKNQASAIIDGANKIIEKTIREIKESHAEQSRTKELRKEILSVKEKISNEPLPSPDNVLPKPVVPKKRIVQKKNLEEAANAKINVGDSVFMTDTQTIGEVIKISNNDITIAFNSITLRTTIDKVAKISKKEARTTARGVSRMDGSSISEIMNKKVSQFQHTLDLRGKRADEALNELDFYLDEASLLGIKQVKILHGKGNGVLRQVIRQALSRRKEVKSFRDEVLELGGAGITVVEL